MLMRLSYMLMSKTTVNGWTVTTEGESVGPVVELGKGTGKIKNAISCV